MVTEPTSRRHDIEMHGQVLNNGGYCLSGPLIHHRATLSPRAGPLCFRRSASLGVGSGTLQICRPACWTDPTRTSPFLDERPPHPTGRHPYSRHYTNFR